MSNSPDQFSLLKSHIDAYTKKDGTTVKAHETRIEAHGVKGMKSTPWRKEFKSEKHLVDWMTKQDGNAELHGVRELEQSAPATKPEAPQPPDHGHMRFGYQDGNGNKHLLHVDSKNINAGGGPDQRTLMHLSNYTFMDNGPEGYDGKAAKLRGVIRGAYDKSGGDPAKVLSAIKGHTKLNSWSLHSHDKPA